MKLTDSFESDLLREVEEMLGLEVPLETVTQAFAATALGFDPPTLDVTIQSVLLAHRRPSLLVQDNRFVPTPSATWSGPLEDHRAGLDAVLPAVGRIDVADHPDFEWVGTGVLVKDDVVATNRHVALEFAERQGNGFCFRTFPQGPASSQVDFLAEHDRAGTARLAVHDILHIEDDSGPDLAFLLVEATGREHVELSTAAAQPNDMVVAVGYPREDPDLSAELAERIFQGIYDVKRLAPGKLKEVSADRITHDCSTLPGNSGSVILDVETGKAIAIHFFGGALANFALPAAIVDARLQGLP